MLLGYGVMVTLQILVLPFLVRVRVSQRNRQAMLGDFFIHYFFYIYVQGNDVMIFQFGGDGREI